MLRYYSYERFFAITFDLNEISLPDLEETRILVIVICSTTLVTKLPPHLGTGHFKEKMCMLITKMITTFMYNFDIFHKKCHF